ncbi:MAG: hypothetical protein IPM39_12320 [Chloroflexi bacterium]|nr:hypothetical protein [Chloroflexota bacterium]
MPNIHNKFIVLGSILLMTLTACVSSENLITTEYDKLMYPASTLMYTHSFTTSSATGKCAGQASDRWYGAESDPNVLLDAFKTELSRNGWAIWSEDTVQMWRKESDDGLFTFSIHVFKEETIDPNQAYYNLPDSVLLQLTDYQSAYVTTISHMSPSDANRCLRP